MSDAREEPGPRTRIVAYAEDRVRLLEHGEMAMPVYSSRELLDAARGIYRTMTDAADLMGLALTEPTVEEEAVDSAGCRIVTVRAGVFDADELRSEPPPCPAPVVSRQGSPGKDGAGIDQGAEHGRHDERDPT
ncbi:MAG TPA: hypothetical protein VIZ43_10900 [Trebonia sp.]